MVDPDPEARAQSAAARLRASRHLDAVGRVERRQDPRGLRGAARNLEVKKKENIH